MTQGVELPGLDGANPLGFLAALGTLRVLNEHSDGIEPRLGWIEKGTWIPFIVGPRDVDAINQIVMSDLSTWSREKALQLAYLKNKGVCVPPTERGAIRDLKPPPQAMAEFLDDIASRASSFRRRSVDLVASFASEVVVDNNGKTKPTAFHFTAGQQTFLKMVGELIEGVQHIDVERALLGPWRRTSKLPSLSWDATATRYYALRASDPSKEKRGSEPGAEWLAFRALSFFPVAPRGSRLITTGVVGRWKSSAFTWPLWGPPSSAKAIRSLLSYPKLGESSASVRSCLGIEAVFSSDIKRADQGGYGSFSPARVK